MKKNYRLIFNVLLIGCLSLVFASCAREKGAISYHNDKLRKQSFEIENSKPSQENRVSVSTPENPTVITRETKEEVKTTSNNLVTENKIVPNNSPAIGEKVEVKKHAPVQNLIAKKIAKKLKAEKSTALDQKLKMAIIFGAIALILFILDFVPFFWLLGTVALVIAIVFLLMWVLEQ